MGRTWELRLKQLMGTLVWHGTNKLTVTLTDVSWSRSAVVATLNRGHSSLTPTTDSPRIKIKKN